MPCILPASQRHDQLGPGVEADELHLAGQALLFQRPQHAGRDVLAGREHAVDAVAEGEQQLLRFDQRLVGRVAGIFVGREDFDLGKLLLQRVETALLALLAALAADGVAQHDHAPFAAQQLAQVPAGDLAAVIVVGGDEADDASRRPARCRRSARARRPAAASRTTRYQGLRIERRQADAVDALGDEILHQVDLRLAIALGDRAFPDDVDVGLFRPSTAPACTDFQNSCDVALGTTAISSFSRVAASPADSRRAGTEQPQPPDTQQPAAESTRQRPSAAGRTFAMQ